MKARILNNYFYGVYTDEFIQQNFNNVVNGQLVSDWVLTEILPNENIIKPIWVNNNWIEGSTPEEIIKMNVPSNIQARQLRLSLVHSGFEINTITNTINTLDEPTKSIALIEWEYATSFDRDNVLLNSIGSILGLTEQDIDNIFILAKTF